MDQPLRARLLAGEPAAFAQLFDDHARAVYRYAVRVTGDWAGAEDVVSLTFLEAWRLRARVRPEGDSLRPWLLGIATNVLRNSRRAARRHQNAMTRLPPRRPEPDLADQVVERIADAETLAAARAALARLRPAEREVLALCVWAELEHAEVAEALGVRVGTVRSRLSRARSRLRTLTDDELARRTKAGRDSPLSQRRAGRGQVPGGRAAANNATDATAVNAIEETC
jgi:RNA polymerase sigma factor (sigma-70 family)